MIITSFTSSRRWRFDGATASSWASRSGDLCKVGYRVSKECIVVSDVHKRRASLCFDLFMLCVGEGREEEGR